ncbi:MAG: hypothetical protein NTZ74_00750 [Chloroflexi bacterium]|nr:hypothetical protein [Chloroflexota bacterium]
MIRIVILRKFATHTSLVNDPQITFSEDVMIIKPQGIETKRMVLAPLAIAAMTDPGKGISFLKISNFNPNGQYPQGCNLVLYKGPDNLMFEMESFREEQTVLPGSTIENQETWKILETGLDWNNPTALQNEFKRTESGI